MALAVSTRPIYFFFLLPLLFPSSCSCSLSLLLTSSTTRKGSHQNPTHPPTHHHTEPTAYPKVYFIAFNPTETNNGGASHCSSAKKTPRCQRALKERERARHTYRPGHTHTHTRWKRSDHLQLKNTHLSSSFILLFLHI